MSTSTAQAPWAKRVAMITQNTTAVRHAPIALTATLKRQPGSRSRSQWRTMPNCDSVNEMNTPIAYSGSIACSRALKTITSSAANTPSATIPFENTSRSPRLANWRGRYRSRESRLASGGNPLKLVLAASSRITAVATWITK